jgi:hypothetical protein
LPHHLQVLPCPGIGYVVSGVLVHRGMGFQERSREQGRIENNG